MGSKEKRDSGHRESVGLEEQWEQKNSGFKGAEGECALRKVSTEGQ